MKPIRLLFVLTSPVRGGVEEVVLGLLRRLDPSEFRLGLAAPAPLLDGFAADLRGVSVDAEPMTVEPFLRRDAFGPLSRFVRSFHPDIVNSHLFRSTAAAAPVAAWHGVPLVETYHGREGWRRGLVRGRFLPDRLVARLVDRVIAVSEAARTFLITGKGYPKAKVVVVANGRDLSLYQPGLWRDAVRAELGLAPATPVVGVGVHDRIGTVRGSVGHHDDLEPVPGIALRERGVELGPDAPGLVVRGDDDRHPRRRPVPRGGRGLGAAASQAQQERVAEPHIDEQRGGEPEGQPGHHAATSVPQPAAPRATLRYTSAVAST